MSRHLHLLQLAIRPNAYMSDVVSGCFRVLQQASVESQTKIIHAYKIDGENRLIFVIDGVVDELFNKVAIDYGEQVESTCIPLRCFRQFARDVLGVEDKGEGVSWNPEGRLYLLSYELNYQGLELSKLIDVWKQEAESTLSLVKAGKLVSYKAVAKRQVYSLVSMSSNDLMDNVLFTLPIMKHLGNQLRHQIHSISPLKI